MDINAIANPVFLVITFITLKMQCKQFNLFTRFFNNVLSFQDRIVNSVVFSVIQVPVKITEFAKLRKLETISAYVQPA